MIKARSKRTSATAPQGFRLQKLEVWNWGTFDGHVYTVRPEGKSILLIGQNGSGKSTLIDAILTLLVRPGVRSFNVAAGAKKRERDERTYLLGAFDRSSDEETGGTRVKYLRQKGDHFSVILGHFKNDDGKEFTVAQVLYLTADQSVEKIYCFAEEERSIQADFTGLESADSMLKTLRRRGLRVTRTHQEFESWFSKITRIRPKAMEVFNQTVAVKDIQRLNAFIRSHMLEPHAWNERVDRLLVHFLQLSEAHDALVKVREQRELLEPVANLGLEFEQFSQEMNRTKNRIAAFGAYFSQKSVEFLLPAIEDLELRQNRTSAERQNVINERTALQEQIRSLRNEVDNAGGDRLKQIPSLLKAEQVQRESKRAAAARFQSVCARLPLGISGQTLTVDEAAYRQIQKRLPAIGAELNERLSQQSAEQQEIIIERGELRRQLSAARAEYDSLAARRDNIPEWCVQLRAALCNELDLKVKELPFAAELMRVDQAEREWESAIEKVLHNFALSLLVPQKHVKLVGAYLDRTKLFAQGRGRRLVYLEVTAQNNGRTQLAAGPHSLYHKLEFRDGHPLLPWLKAELIRNFDVACVTLDEFHKAGGRAITQNRQMRSGRSRFEKDDRDEVADPRNYVLGWDNREKKQHLAAEIGKLEQQEAALTATLQSSEQQLRELRDQVAAVAEMQQVTAFQTIDFAAHDQEIARLEQERDAIEQSSDVLQLLKQRIAEAITLDEALADRGFELAGDERELGLQLATAIRLLDNAEADLRKRETDGSLERSREMFTELETVFAESPLTLDNFAERRNEFRAEQDERMLDLQKEIEPLRNRLTEAMSRFLRHWPEESQDLRASTDYLSGFLEVRQRILDDDLPRFEARFKERLNRKVIEEIGLFHNSLEQERRRISEKIEVLNGSLEKLEYRPGTHIRLTPRKTKDAEINEFRRKLRECIEGEFEETFEANEARFLKIKDLIFRLKNPEDRRWREKVTDIRGWFDFQADVIDRQTGEIVSSYEDSGGQSGGEKAKLAFTILVAAIAYQYDLDPEQPASDRFHFVVVDEMFSKVDDQHAEYALDLFKQFGLQLLIVAPLDAKARVTQPYVGCYLHAVKKDNRSAVFEMTAREFEETAGDITARSDLLHHEYHPARRDPK